MNKTLLVQYLMGGVHEVLSEWPLRLIANGTETGLPTGRVAPHALVQIYDDLQRVIKGCGLEELKPLLQLNVIPGDQKLGLNFPVLVEVFNTLEEVFLDRLMGENVGFEPIWLRLAFEQLSGKLHLILDSQVETFCGCCIGELAAVCAKSARVRRIDHLMEALDPVLTTTPVQHPMIEQQGRTHTPKPASIRLVTLLRNNSAEIQERWIEDLNADPVYNGQKRLQESVQQHFDSVMETALGMRRGAIHLPDGQPHLSGHRALRLCHIGEEVIALALLESGDLVHSPSFAVRSELNRVFHTVVRTNCTANCHECRTRLNQGKLVFANLEKNVKEPPPHPESQQLSKP